MQVKVGNLTVMSFVTRILFACFCFMLVKVCNERYAASCWRLCSYDFCSTCVLCCSLRAIYWYACDLWLSITQCCVQSVCWCIWFAIVAQWTLAARRVRVSSCSVCLTSRQVDAFLYYINCSGHHSLSLPNQMLVLLSLTNNAAMTLPHYFIATDKNSQLDNSMNNMRRQTIYIELLQNIASIVHAWDKRYKPCTLIRIRILASYRQWRESLVNMKCTNSHGTIQNQNWILPKYYKMTFQLLLDTLTTTVLQHKNMRIYATHTIQLRKCDSRWGMALQDST